MRISGIYKIQSIIKPERIYIGSAIYIKSRGAGHLYDLRNNKHSSQKLQRHYNKYGKSDLVFSVLSGCEKEKLLEQEQFYIDAYKPYFNNRIIAASSNLGLSGRWHHSEETKKKFSESLKGNKHTLGMKHTIEARRKISEALRLRIRKPMSDETKQKLSDALKGRKRVFSELHKLRLSESLKGRKYKPRSDESKLRQSKSMKGRVVSLETRKNISAALRGKKRSIESRINISNGHKGYIPSDETRRRLSESGKKAWVQRKLNKIAI